MVESLRAGYARDPQGTLDSVQRTIEDGPRLLAAMAREETNQRRRATDTTATEADVFADIVAMYSSSAEAGFRTYASLALDLEGIAAGQAPAARTASPAPMLGEIEGALAKSDSPLARSLRRVLNRPLRNAKNHEDLIVSADGSSVKAGGTSLSAEEAVESLALLTGCVVGMDAAVVCWGLENGVLFEPSAADASAGSAWARRLMTRALLFASSADLVDAGRADQGTFVVTLASRVSRADLLTALAGIAELYPDVQELEVRDASGALLISVERGAFREYRDAREEVRDLASFYPLVSAAVHVGTSREEAALDALAAMIRMLAPDEEGLQTPKGKAAALRAMPQRIAYIQEFVRASLAESEVAQQLESSLRRALAAARAAKHGDQAAIGRMSSALQPAFAWSAARDARFGGMFAPIAADSPAA